MHSLVIRARRAAILVVCAAIAAACNSSPVDVDSSGKAAVTEVITKSLTMASGTFSVSPVKVDFGSTETNRAVTLTNSGSTSRNWTAGEPAGWLELASTSGTIAAGSSKTVGLRVNRTGKAAGNYSTHVNVSVGTAGSVQLPVSMTVPSMLSVSPVNVDFGATETNTLVTLTNRGSTSLNWTANEGVGWLELASTSGTITAGSSKTVGVKVDRTGKAAGSYTTNVSFSAGTAGSAQVPVSMTVPSTFSVSPLNVAFGSTATSTSVTLTNSGSTSLNWTASEGVGWLALGSTSGTIAAKSNKTLGLNINRTGVTAGSYTTNVSFSAGTAGSAKVPVSMTVPSTSPTPTGITVNVRDFGAKGNGLSDDSPAFDRAIDALPASGGTVFVPAGTYLLEPMFLSPVRPLSLIRKTNISIVGQGKDSTILKMVNGTYDGSTFMIVILESDGIEIKDLTFDMNRDGSYYGDEQSHIVRVESSTDVRFSDIRFMNSPGDGIKFIGLGEIGNPWVDGVWIENSYFYNLWRNGITIQRGVRNLRIRGNTFERVSQQSVSAEPTGFDGGATDILIENNVIRAFSGSYSIALTGGGKLDTVKRLTFRNNVVENGAVYFLWVDGLEVEGNTLRGGPGHAPLRLQNIEGGVIANNSVTGIFEDGPGVIQLLNSADALSYNVIVRDNEVDASAGLTGIYVRDARGLITVTRNEVLGSGGKRGIVFENIIAGVSSRNGFTVMNNNVQNFKDAIAFIARGDRFANVRIDSNTANHDQQPSVETVGILLDRTGSPQTWVQIVGNVFGAGIKTPLRVLSGD